MAVKATANITLTRVDDGAAGKGIKSTSITYQAGTSGTAAPTGAWSTNVPSVPQGQYLWSKTVITYTDDTTSTTYSVAYIPKNGTTGATGATGTGIQSITQEYYLSTSKTSQTGGSWVTSMPTWSSGKYLWTRYKITYENPTSTAYTSPICDSSWEAVNDIQIGGRNLLFETSGSTMSDNHNEWMYHGATPTSDSYHGCCIYRSNEVWAGIQFNFNKIVERSAIKVGDVLTYSIKCKTDDSTHLNGVYLMANYMDNNESSGMGVFDLGISVPYADWVTLSHTFTYTQSVDDQIKAGRSIRMSYEILHTPTAADKYYYFACPKLEFGNKATDWTPAPEDMATNEDLQDTDNTANDALGKVESTEDRVTITESELQILKDSISTMVTDENGTSLMTQKGDGWTFNMGSINKALDNTASALNSAVNDINDTASLISSVKEVVDSIEKKTAYITMSTDETGAPCIELGKSDNPFKLRITNTSVDFLESGTKIAYVSNQNLYIERAIIKNELQIGESSGFIWRKRENGNLGLRWTGG